MKSIIVAMDEKYGIGAENDLLWLRDLPDDLANFRKVTIGNTVIMGRKTFDSIKKPLINRQNIVITRSADFQVPEGVLTVSSLKDAYRASDEHIFIIGGGEIYRQAINDVDQLYVTEVGAIFPQATVLFPEVEPSIWQEVSRVSNKAGGRNAYDFDFVVYRRR